uniref:Endo/exonuclease/phosphatase domain-containing protein n=1 Tax=Steinernema glaseri TaxID=37863 RepID=A0A1I7YRK5_9BILA
MASGQVDYEKVMADFVEITKTDDACAHFFLQDVNWNLQEGVAAYFNTLNVVGPVIERQENRVKDSKGNIVDLVDSDVEHDEGPTSSKRLRGAANDPDSVKELGIVSWNIDGTEVATVNMRIKAVLCIIARLNPEIILLQEVVPQALLFLQEKLGKMYNIMEGTTYSSQGEPFPYFTAIIISKNIRVEKSSFKPFGNTGMGRGLQIVECKYNGLPVKIVNCHLESMKDYSAQRKAQFKELMGTLKQFTDEEPGAVVVGGGDLNIRDAEIDHYPSGIKDAWIEAGSVAKDRWTWDTSKNDNKFKGSVRARFDRLYYAGPLRFAEFSLHGQKRIRTLHMFPSDHWALSCRLFRPE